MRVHFMSKKNFKNIVSDAVNIPKDVILGVPIVRVMGQEEFYVENYRGILEYTDTLIRVQTKIGQIHLKGKKMEISYYTNDEMKITGYIEKLEYHRGG